MDFEMAQACGCTARARVSSQTRRSHLSRGIQNAHGARARTRLKLTAFLHGFQYARVFGRHRARAQSVCAGRKRRDMTHLSSRRRLKSKRYIKSQLVFEGRAAFKFRSVCLAANCSKSPRVCLLRARFTQKNI